MDAVSRDRRLRVFRATDAFALEAYRLSTTLNATAHPGLVGELRRTAVRSGGAVVAASASEPGGEGERQMLERARQDLIENRYYLYLARRIGLVEVKAYRGLTARQDAALRELEALLQRGGDEPPRHPT
jgi:four helix bundle protein